MKYQKINCKICSHCKKEKDLDLFVKRKENLDGRDHICKECNRKRRKEYYKNNTSMFRKYNNDYRRANKKDIRNTTLKMLYGITLEEYNDRFIEQGGRCAICGRHQTEFKNKLCVDHDHETDEIRGLLCNKCNFMIGNANDSSDILRNAIKYLEQNVEKATKILERNEHENL